jgi:uncharacterized protein DUF2277
MCRNIKTLFNFDPPVNPEEIRAASLQFVRKISGFNKPYWNSTSPGFVLFPHRTLAPAHDEGYDEGV